MYMAMYVEKNVPRIFAFIYTLGTRSEVPPQELTHPLSNSARQSCRGGTFIGVEDLRCRWVLGVIHRGYLYHGDCPC